MISSSSVGFYPFWFWNNKLDADEIKYQIKEMYDKGIKGFYIHPRQGLQQPYLSESFFKMVDIAIDNAEKYNMDVLLYDEYPYPSGIAGGEVTLGNPHFYATQLIQKSYQLNGGEIRLELPRGKVLSAKAFTVKDGRVDYSNPFDLKDYIGIVLREDSYVVNGLTSYNQKRYFASNPTPTLEINLDVGEYKIFVSVQAEVKNHKYWYNFVDILNPEAVKHFMELTHQRYKKRYSEKFANRIKSIFVDEVEPLWSNRIPAAFIEEFGYDLCDYLPALQDQEHPHHLKVLQDLYNLKYKLFVASFEEPIRDWCHDNHLNYCGEKPSLRLSQLKYMDIPGCEPGHTKAGAKLDIIRHTIRGNARATSSAAYFYEKEGALCECYHSIGWSGTLQDAKIIAEGLLLAGIKYLVPHGFFYSTHGLKKHDAPPSFFFQMPYWSFFKELSNRIDLLAKEFADTYMDAQVLVFDPHSGLPTNQELLEYEELLNGLMSNHIDFQIVDTDILENARIEAGNLYIKDIEASLLIIPSMQLKEEKLQSFIEKYKKAKGQILDGREKSNSELLDIALEIVGPSLSIVDGDREIPGIYTVKRKSNDKTIWFVLNTTNKDYNSEIKADCNLKEVSLDASIQARLSKENDVYKRVIKPYESFILQKSDNENLEEKIYPTIKVPLSEKVDFKFKNKNLIRMYDWNLSLIDENRNVIDKGKVTAIPLSNQLEEGEFEFKPAYQKYFGSEPELIFPEMHLSYSFKFECKYDGPIELVMEPGSIKGDWKIFINNSPEISMGKMKETKTHVRGSLGIDITEYVSEGKNEIKVEVEANNHNDGLLNPLYLAGGFGVELDPLTIVKPINTGYFNDYKNNLFPYYSGVIEYNTNFKIEKLAESDYFYLELETPDEFNDATELAINGGEYQKVLWQPRCIKVNKENLKVGANNLSIKVYTSLIRSFEGMYFNYSEHRYNEV